MSDSADSDISGNWIGFYSYPIAIPPVCFNAVLRELGGRITGTIEDVGARRGNGHLFATVDGVRTGQAVRFTKFYDSGDEHYDTVDYDGVIDAEGTEISGKWDIPGAWSGSFIMTRERGAEAEIAVRRSVSVD